MTTEIRLAGTLTLRANLISYAPLRKYVKYDVAASFKKILITKISFCVVPGEISLSIWGKTERERGKNEEQILKSEIPNRKIWEKIFCFIYLYFLFSIF